MDVLATDVAVAALADRVPLESDDAALRLLEAWAADLDAHPVKVDVETPEPAALRRRRRGTKRSVVAMTLALTLSSTGIAAAVQGDPFAPISYMVHRFDLGHDDRSGPGDLFGMRNDLLGEPPLRDSHARAESRDRPSRSRPANRSSRAPGPSTQASAPIVAHRVPKTTDQGGSQVKPRERQRPLLVQRPHAGVERPKPDSGQTPPHHPELPPTEPIWPKPSSDGHQTPPDRPTS
jgi:hypothetical protein